MKSIAEELDTVQKALLQCSKEKWAYYNRVQQVERNYEDFKQMALESRDEMVTLLRAAQEGCRQATMAFELNACIDWNQFEELDKKIETALEGIPK